MSFTRNIAHDRAVLSALLHRLGLPETLLSPLLAHAEAVRRNADRLGLVSPKDADQVVPRHTADSLLFALVRAPSNRERWVDVGSGAGFPGLVLACCYPDSQFTLLEPQKRRAGFLELLAGDLGLANIAVATEPLEDQPEAAFDVAVARALADPAAAVWSLTRLLRQRGAAIVAVSGGAAVPDGADLVRLEDIGFVDSPGLFSMMTRRG